MEVADYVGSIKSWNPTKGWGHIDCTQTFNTYGKDVFLLRSQLQGASSVSKGDQVTFGIVDNGRGPEAANVHLVGGAGQAGYGSGYVGSVKSWNPSSGWGHIICEATHRIHGKDVFFMRSKILNGTSIEKGMTVQFDVVDGLKGVEATNVRAMQPIKAAAPKAWSTPPPMPQVSKPTRSGCFYGSVKSYSAEKGWGHIDCPQTRAMYGKDMFFMRSALNGSTVSTGDQVQFSVTGGKKGPEATNVKVMSAGQGTYNGTIKLYSADKGYGFIVCDQTRALYDKDIFVHQKELAGAVPNPGDAIQFSVAISETGRPEATEVRLTGNGYGKALIRPTFRPSPY